MKLYQITYQIIYVVRADDKDDKAEVKKKALRKIEAYLDEPDDLRTLLQTAVMDAEPIIKEIKET